MNIGEYLGQGALGTDERIHANKTIIGKDTYTYVFSLASIAPATVGQESSITIENDSYFLAEKMSFFCTNDAVDTQTQETRILPNLTIQLESTSSGRRQMSQPTPLAAIAGSGEFPLIWPQPKLYVPKTTVQLAFSNFSTTDTYRNIFVNMIGTKIYTEGL